MDGVSWVSKLPIILHAAAAALITFTRTLLNLVTVLTQVLRVSNQDAKVELKILQNDKEIS